MNNVELGKYGEKIAKEYLISKKYHIAEMNYRNRYGEIDIIAIDDKFLVFVEVKTRRNDRYGRPVESVDMRKQQRIHAITSEYISKFIYNDMQPRFDIIEVIIKNDEKHINHIINAF